MSCRLVECQYCHELVPDFHLCEQARAAVIERLETSTPAQWVGEVSYWTKFSKEDAEAFLDHFSNCLFSWTYSEDEQVVLAQIDQEFLGAIRPLHSGTCTCDECLECAELLDRVDVFGFKRTWLRLPMMPGYISELDAIQYWMPAIARCGFGIHEMEERCFEDEAFFWIEKSLKRQLSPSQRAAVENYLMFKKSTSL